MSTQNDLQVLTDTLLKVIDKYEKFATKNNDIHLPHVAVIDGLMEKIKAHKVQEEPKATVPIQPKIEVVSSLPAAELPKPSFPQVEIRRTEIDLPPAKSIDDLQPMDTSRDNESLPDSELKK